MHRDLHDLMQETSPAPERELDLDDLWRRGRRRRRLKRAGVVAAGLALIAGLAVLGLPAVRPAPPVVDAPPAAPLRVLHTVQVPEPGTAVAAAGKVWVTSYRGPLRWVDPGSGRTGTGPVASGACGLGGGPHLLVVFRCQDPVAPDGQLVAVDPETGDARWTVDVDGYVTSIAATAERVTALTQAGGDGWLAVFDAATGEELGRVPIERSSVWSVVAGDDRAWVTATRQPDPSRATRRVEVIAVDLGPMTVAGRRTVGEDRGGPQRLALHGSELWLPVQDAVIVVDATTLEQIGEVRVPLAAPEPTTGPAIAIDPDHVWIVDRGGVQAVELEDRTAVGDLELGPLRVTQPPAVLDGRLWVPDRAGDRLVVVGR